MTLHLSNEPASRDWRHEAECAIGGHDLDLWFEEPREAKRVCLTMCPVVAECREWALTSTDAFGVAGGLSERERRRVRGRRRRSVTTTEKKESAA